MTGEQTNKIPCILLATVVKCMKIAVDRMREREKFPTDAKGPAQGPQLYISTAIDFHFGGGEPAKQHGGMFLHCLYAKEMGSE